MVLQDTYEEPNVTDCYFKIFHYNIYFTVLKYSLYSIRNYHESSVII